MIVMVNEDNRAVGDSCRPAERMRLLCGAVPLSFVSFTSKRLRHSNTYEFNFAFTCREICPILSSIRRLKVTSWLP